MQKRLTRPVSRRMMFPPTFHFSILRGTPPGCLRDLSQEAWLAYLAGRNPNTAAKNFLAREFIHSRREVPMSQIPPAVLWAPNRSTVM